MKSPPVLSSISPDLAPYPIDAYQAPPKWAKLVPLVFWGSLVAIICGMYVQSSRNSALTSEADDLSQTLADTRAKEVVAEQAATALEARAVAASRIANWLGKSPTVQPALVAILKGLSGKAQVTSFRLERSRVDEPTYRLYLGFNVSDKQASEALKAVSNELSKVGWNFTSNETAPGNNETVYDAYISPRSSR